MQAGATDASANAAGRQATAAEAAATAPPPLQPPSLQAHLNRGHLPTDLLTLPVVMLVHGSILARSALLPREAWYIRRLVAVQALAMGTGVLAPAAYLAARQPIVAVLRLLDMLVLPLLVDGLR